MSPKVSPFEGATRQDSFLVFPEHLVIIGLDTDDDASHVLHDPRINDPIDEKMVLNIKAYGVFEPVLTQKLPDGRVVVLDGRQRVRCAREANRRLKAEGAEVMRIPVANPKRGDLATATGIMISSNEIRRDDSMAVKAAKAQKLHNQFGRTVEEIAVMFGVSNVTIYSWLKLEDAAPEVQKAIEDGELSTSAGVKLATLPQAVQVEKLAQLKARAPKSKNGKPKVGTALIQQSKKADRNHEAAQHLPGKRILGRIARDGKAAGLSSDFVAGVRFAMGELDANRIAGLHAFLNQKTVTKHNEVA